MKRLSRFSLKALTAALTIALATFATLAAPALTGAPTAAAQAQSTAATLDTSQFAAETQNAPCKGVADAAGRPALR